MAKIVKQFEDGKLYLVDTELEVSPRVEITEDTDMSEAYAAFEEALKNVPATDGIKEMMNNFDVSKVIPVLTNSGIGRQIGDTNLWVTVKYLVSEGVTATIKPDLAEHLGYTYEGLLLLAAENIDGQATVKDVADFLAAIYPEDVIDSMRGNQIVISNDSHFLGAIWATDRDSLRKAADLLHAKKISLIPSSTHEFLAVALGDYDDLLEMNKEVNASQVEPRERMEPAIYTYDVEADKFEQVR